MTLQLGKACLRVQHRCLALGKSSGTFNQPSLLEEIGPLDTCMCRDPVPGSETPLLTSSLKSWVTTSSLQVLGENRTYIQGSCDWYIKAR